MYSLNKKIQKSSITSIADEASINKSYNH